VQKNELRGILEEHNASGREGLCVVNVFGVVLSSSAPSTSKKGDWMTCVVLEDETMSADHDDDNNNSDDHQIQAPSTIQLMIFTKKRDSLPVFREAGDVLRLHRVRIQVSRLQ